MIRTKYTRLSYKKKMNDKNIYKTDKNEVSFEFLYCIGGYATYNVTVKSDGFMGHSTFCISTKHVDIHINTINLLLKDLRGGIKLQDCESNSYIDLIFKDSRTMIVEGQLGGSHQTHMIKFEFRADQTILRGLKRELSYD